MTSTSKKYLSNKKTAQQTISISPALKEWINRYVNVNQRKRPNDERFKSVSAFYNYIMGKIMEIFEKGKTIDDLKRVENKKTKDFYDRFTFNATIPLYEMVIESNRYTQFSFDYNTRFLLAYLDFFRREVKPRNFKDVEIFFEGIRSRFAKTNVSKDMRLEVFPGKNQKPARGTLEFIGKFKNIHFENCKFFAAVFGLLGVYVTDITYSAKDYYCRLDLIETDLLFSDNLAKKERLKLIEKNVNLLINYSRLIDDEKDEYLWMKLAQDNMVFIYFKNQQAFNKWITLIEKDLQKFENNENFNKKILKFFEKLHWIRFVSEQDLTFQVEQPIESSGEQKQWLIDYLSKFSEISQKEGIYSFKN